MPNQIRSRYDVVVVGARCAGAATAMLLARKGARVLLVERDRPGTDTMSTHALMRGAVMQLQSWGLLDRVRAAGTPPIRRTSFIYGDEAVDVDIRPAHGTEALYAPRRRVLDAVLASAAAASGAQVVYETSAVGLFRGASGQVAGVDLKAPSGTHAVRCGVLVGADGRRSRIAREIGAPVLHQGSHATSVIYAYVDGLPNEGYRWYYAPGISGGMIPTNDRQNCVFVALPPATFAAEVRGRGAEAIWSLASARLPEMGQRLRGARPVGRPILFAGERGYLRRSQGPGWALVGDAGYFKDPATAHGITDALRDAEILAEAIAGNRLTDYPPLRDALSADLFTLTDEIASFEWTIEELKRKHVALNEAMKQTQTWLAGQRLQAARAA